MQNGQLWNYTDYTIEEHASVKRDFHYFHSCHLRPFYILGSASCSTGSCSFRFNNIGHVINVLKIICSIPFYKSVYIFGANSSHISYTEFQALAAVYPLKRIFKLNTFCVSDFKFTTRAISENPRRLSTVLKSNCHHTWIEDGFKSRLTTIETNRSWSETIRPGIDYFRRIL